MKTTTYFFCFLSHAAFREPQDGHVPFSQAERDELVDERASAQNSNSRKAFNQHLKKLKVSVDCFSHATLAVCAWLIVACLRTKS
jgi:hypothetical protein